MSEVTTQPSGPQPVISGAIKIKAKKPARSHKSKKQQKQKSSVRVVNDGFIERNRKPAIIGTTLKSRMVRVDADFAEWMRQEAMKNGISITEVSRSVFQMLTD